MRIVWLFLSIVFIAGCDGYMPVKGRLIASSPELISGDCHARLQDVSYTDHVLDTGADGSFQVGWVVAPKRQTYQIIVSCPGFVDAQRIVEYGKDVEPGTPADLGEIHLARKPEED